MAQKHNIYDTDLHFKINPLTRAITDVSGRKSGVIQYDHNSERITFEISRYVEGFDLLNCNSVQIHYVNVSRNGRQKSEGVYDVEDMQISPDNSNVCILSWLISNNATCHVGSLNFLVRFSYISEGGKIDYAWNSAIYTNLSVAEGIYNGESVVRSYADILAQWKETLYNAGYINADTMLANIGSLRGEIEVERSRITNLAKLKEGSTTGDAELADARVGANGIVYDNVGEATRKQVSSLSNHIDRLQRKIGIFSVNDWEIGGINTSTGENVPSNRYIRTLYPIELPRYSELALEIADGYNLYIYWFDDNDTFVRCDVKKSNHVSFVVNYPKARFVILKEDFGDEIVDLSWIDNVKIESNTLVTKNELETVKESLVNSFIYNESYHPLTLNWEFGGIHSSTGDNVTSYTFLRSPDFLTFDKDIEILISVFAGFAFIYTYDETGVLESYKSYSSNTIVQLLASKKYRFVLSPGFNPVAISKADEYGIFSARLRFNLSSINNKTVNLLGDSITSIDYTRPTWWETIANRVGVTFNNYGQSGTTLAHTDARHLWDYSFNTENAEDLGYNPDDPKTWNTGNCIVERVDEMDTTADAVVIMGGTNDSNVPRGSWDSTDTATFFGALNVLMKELLTIFAGKPVLFCTMPQSKKAYSENVADPLSELLSKDDSSTLSLQLRAEAIKIKCKQYGIPCLDLFNQSGINGVDSGGVYFRSGDNLHPSTIGQTRIAALVQAELEKLLLDS